MRSGVIIVSDETPVLVEKVRFYCVGFVERFYLANRCRPTHTGGDMLNPLLFLAVQFELRCSPSGRLELCSLVSKYLFGNTIPFDSSLKQ